MIVYVLFLCIHNMSMLWTCLRDFDKTTTLGISAVPLKARVVFAAKGSQKNSLGLRGHITCCFLWPLRIMGSQKWWFGDPKTLLYRFKSLYRRVQWFLGTLPIKQDTLSLDVLALFARGRGTFRCGFARRLRREKPSAQYQDLGERLPLLPIGVVHDSKRSILDGSILWETYQNKQIYKPEM